MMEWKDYRSEDSNEIDTWLDDETVRQTGIENSWAAEVRYWSENADMDGFWCKSVFEGNALIGALYLIEWKDEDANGFTLKERENDKTAVDAYRTFM